MEKAVPKEENSLLIDLIRDLYKLEKLPESMRPNAEQRAEQTRVEWFVLKMSLAKLLAEVTNPAERDLELDERIADTKKEIAMKETEMARANSKFMESVRLDPANLSIHNQTLQEIRTKDFEIKDVQARIEAMSNTPLTQIANTSQHLMQIKALERRVVELSREIGRMIVSLPRLDDILPEYYVQACLPKIEQLVDVLKYMLSSDNRESLEQCLKLIAANDKTWEAMTNYLNTLVQTELDDAVALPLGRILADKWLECSKEFRGNTDIYKKLEAFFTPSAGLGRFHKGILIDTLTHLGVTLGRKHPLLKLDYLQEKSKKNSIFTPEELDRYSKLCIEYYIDFLVAVSKNIKLASYLEVSLNIVKFNSDQMMLLCETAFDMAKKGLENSGELCKALLLYCKSSPDPKIKEIANLSQFELRETQDPKDPYNKKKYTDNYAPKHDVLEGALRDALNVIMDRCDVKKDCLRLEFDAATKTFKVNIRVSKEKLEMLKRELSLFVPFETGMESSMLMSQTLIDQMTSSMKILLPQNNSLYVYLQLDPKEAYLLFARNAKKAEISSSINHGLTKTQRIVR